MEFLLTWEFWAAAARISVPLALAALGVLVGSRSGYLNIGVEGVMLFAAFFAVAGTMAGDSPWAGIAAAIMAGIVVNLIVVWLAVPVGMGYVLSGVVIFVLALGFTGFLVRDWFPMGTSLTGNTLRPLWGLRLQPLFYVAIVAAVAMAYFFRRTRAGLIVRAAGEGAEVATTFGVNVPRLRLWAAVAGGALIGLAGASLSMGVVGSFSDDMTAGRGFIALACVILGGWRPLGVVAAAGFFGMIDALHYALASRQAGDLGEIIVVLPYVATLIALAALWGRTQGPTEEVKELQPRIF
jgi:simple sugar transport system permease protein